MRTKAAAIAARAAANQPRTQITPQNAEQELIDDMARFQHDPYGWVLYSFDWDAPPLKGMKLENWQRQLLENLGKALRKGSVKTAEQVWKYVGQAIRIARRSGHGVGKSAVVSWIILWAMSTFPDTKGIVTANTDTQLKTKTWPELAKWYALFIAKHWFTLTATAIFSNDPEHERTWRFDAIPWSENNTEAFAGMHNKDKRIVLIFDEASAIADKIWEVAEGALTDKDTEIIWLAFGNPTLNTGRFHDCFNSLRHRWDAEGIDSRSVSITDKVQIQQWVDDHGEDSDFVRVRVRGVEPNSSADQFIPADLVEGARGRQVKRGSFEFAPVIIGVDPKYSPNGPDEFVIAKRQGLVSKVLGVYRTGTDDDNRMASIIARFEDEEKADAVFIDFGYGTGIHSAGRLMKREWTLVQFGSKPPDVAFLNMRSYMWGQMKQWLKDGGCLPNDEQLCTEIKSPEAYLTSGKNAGKIVLESKDEMRARNVPSPNRADALALTFAMEVLSDHTDDFPHGGNRMRSDYDPQEREEAAA